MTDQEQKIIDIIIQEFLNNKKIWDARTEGEQTNTRWVKWVSLHIIAARLGKPVYDTMNILASMKSKKLLESKHQINQQFFACPIQGFRQHAEKDYYCIIAEK